MLNINNNNNNNNNYYYYYHHHDDDDDYYYYYCSSSGRARCRAGQMGQRKKDGAGGELPYRKRDQ